MLTPAVTTRLGIIDLCGYKHVCRHYSWDNGVKSMTVGKQCGDLIVRFILLSQHNAFLSSSMSQWLI